MGFDEAGAKILFSGPVFKLDPVSRAVSRMTELDRERANYVYERERDREIFG